MLYFLAASSATGIELVALILAFCVAICFAMTAHEYAHAKMAYRCGDHTAALSGRLTLNPFAHISGFGLLSFLLFGFGWAKPVPINPANFRSYKKDSTKVVISGVLTNFVLAFVFSGLLFFAYGPLLAAGNLALSFLAYVIEFGFFINIALAVFNLLPIPPLDGFNLLATWTRYENKFIRFLQQYGIFLLILFILPIFGGASILSLLYNYVSVPFFWFWGLFV